MNRISNQNIIIKTTPDGKYGLGKDGKPYVVKMAAYTIKGKNGQEDEYELRKKWVQVHYASYERAKALQLLNEQ